MDVELFGWICANCHAISYVFAQEGKRISLSSYVLREGCIHYLCRLTGLDSSAGEVGAVVALSVDH